MASSAVRMRARQRARAATEHPWVERFLRFGFVMRGVVYLIPAILALRLALGRGGAAITQGEAIAMLGREPFGRLLLATVAFGLASYALWGVIRAVLDPLERGASPHGVARRLGYLSSGLGYGGLLLLTLSLLTGLRHPSRDWLARVLAWPPGPWLVGAIGLSWIAGAGISEIVKAWRGSFTRDLALDRAGAHERHLAAWLGRFGIAARGLVLGIIGVSLVSAALHADATRRRGMGGALLDLSHAPHGRFLLGFVALGLMAFGLYSICCARWARTKPRPAAREAIAVPSAPPAHGFRLWPRRSHWTRVSAESENAALLLFNPSSGKGGGEERVKELRVLMETLRAHGIATRGVIPGSAHAVRRIARAAARSGRQLVVVAGGDGTVHDAAAELAGSRTALGVIPHGTMNNVALALGIPLEPDRAAALLATGHTRPIDLGRISYGGSHRGAFLECAGAGLSAFAAVIGETIEKGRWHLIPRALRQFFEAKRAILHVEIDGRPLDVATNMVTVLNSPILGNHLLAAPEARMDDGQLDVLVYEGMSETDLARHYVAVARGEPSSVPAHRARRVRIWSDRPMMTHTETHEGHRRRVVEIEVVPAAVKVIVGHGMALKEP